MGWKLGKNTDGRTPDLIEIDYANGDAVAEITLGDLVTNTAGVFSVAVTGGQIMGIASSDYKPPVLQDAGDYTGLVLPITTETEIEADLLADTDPATITPYDAYDISGATINIAAKINGDFIVTRIGKVNYDDGLATTVFGYFVNANGSRK